MNGAAVARAPGVRDPIDVVVPIYNAAADVARCVESVLAHTSNYRLVLIDDGSTDPAIAKLFSKIEQRSLAHVHLFRNEHNAGFTETANRGMQHSRADVVLLNSDTIVTPGWLDALARCAASDPSIGTITPFSNNAEICSYPRFCVDNGTPDAEAAARARSALARAAVPTYPDLPTGVGFCMYVRRALIDAIGTFDPAFGRGYGEENDLCLRAARAGWRNVLCDDAFVVHVGGRSFEAEKAKLGEINLPLVVARHPHYVDLVRAYIAADPLRAIRDAALIAQRAHAGDVPGVLHVLHGGGGTEQHARALIAASRSECRHYLAIAIGDRWRIEDHANGERATALELVRGVNERWCDFVGAIASTFNIAVVHVHHLSACREGLVDALRGLDLPYGITVHDLWLACPTVTLTRADGRFCGGETDPSLCSRCLAEQPAVAAVDIEEWRRRHAEVVAGAAFLIAPSRWAADMLTRYFPVAAERIDVIAHAAPAARAVGGDDADAPRERDPALPSMAVVLPADDIATVAIVGAIGPDKGARRVERLAALVRERRARVRFVVIGYLDVQHASWQSADAVLTVHGRYDARDLPALFAHYRVALVAYPSEGPESFSLTLSEAWAAGMPAIVPPIGALVERVGNSGAGWVWTPEQWRDEALMLERIIDVLASPQAIHDASHRARSMVQPTVRSMVAHTLQRYRSALDRQPARIAEPLANARLRDALGYVPWSPPAGARGAGMPANAAATPTATVTSSAHTPMHDGVGVGTSIARVALRWRHTAIGRMLYRVTPAPLVAALRERLR